MSRASSRRSGSQSPGRHLRVDVDPVDAVAGPPRPADAQGAAHPEGHEPLAREGDIGLVGAQLLGLQPLGQPAQLPGLAQVHAHHGLAVHGGQSRLRVQLGAHAEAEGPRPGQLGLAQVEAGQAPAVGEGEGRSRLQASHPEQHRPAVLLAVEEVQEEAALRIVHRPYCSRDPSGAAIGAPHLPAPRPGG